MFNLETILQMWKEDSVIDDMNLDHASQQTPMLHAKYLEMLSLSKLQYSEPYEITLCSFLSPLYLL